MFKVGMMRVILFAVLLWVVVFHCSAEAQMTKLKVAYPTLKGIQLVLDEMALRAPKAKSLAPENFIDVSYLRELEQGGFIKKLSGD